MTVGSSVFTCAHPPSSPPRRCLWPLGRGPCGEFAGEVPVRPGGVRPEPVPQPAHTVRETAAPLAFPPHRLFLRHRTVIFRPLGR